MKRGRRPKPRALRVLEGTPGHRPLPPDIRPSGDVEMPPHLEGEAKAEWNRVIGQLRTLGLATSLDRAALAGYCQSWARWVEAELALRRYGTIVKLPTGFPMQSPYLAVANAAMKQMREFLVEFGMTPAARTRVDADELPRRPEPMVTATDGAPPRSPARFFRDA